MSDEAQNLNFDETLSENRRAPNLLSIPSRSKFHLATKRAIDYHEVVRADGAVDCVFPSVILENAFKFHHRRLGIPRDDDPDKMPEY